MSESLQQTIHYVWPYDRIYVMCMNYSGIPKKDFILKFVIKWKAMYTGVHIRVQGLSTTMRFSKKMPIK
jgi:hypothetical protein